MTASTRTASGRYLVATASQVYGAALHASRDLEAWEQIESGPAYPDGGDKKLQLRLNAYNALNHPIAYPDVGTNLTMRFENGVLSDPNFGRLPTEDNAIGPANKFGRRIIQLAVRFTF